MVVASFLIDAILLAILPICLIAIYGAILNLQKNLQDDLKAVCDRIGQLEKELSEDPGISETFYNYPGILPHQANPNQGATDSN